MASARDELRKLVEDLGKIPPELRRQIRPALRRVAEPVLAEARANASWSSRIPGAMKISPSFSKRRPGISIVVSARRAPHARANEDLDADGRVTHPVFGNRRNWVVQKARPFLFRAVRSKADGAMSEEAGRVVDQAARSAGFR